MCKLLFIPTFQKIYDIPWATNALSGFTDINRIRNLKVWPRDESAEVLEILTHLKMAPQCDCHPHQLGYKLLPTDTWWPKVRYFCIQLWSITVRKLRNENNCFLTDWHWELANRINSQSWEVVLGRYSKYKVCRKFVKRFLAMLIALHLTPVTHLVGWS